MLDQAHLDHAPAWVIAISDSIWVYNELSPILVTFEKDWRADLWELLQNINALDDLTHYTSRNVAQLAYSLFGP